MPNQEHRITWQLPWDDWMNRKSNPLYFGVLVEYDINENEIEEAGLIIHVTWNSAEIIKSL